MRDSIDRMNATNDFIQSLDPDLTVPYEAIFTAIDGDRVDDLTDTLLSFIADVIASLIDAGSEREPILENDELRIAIRNQVQDFSTDEWKGH
jgi:hypothetical protein